jgi:iron-sulfur cluster assembly protein
MALDEPKENDEIIEDNGVTFLVEKSLFEQAKPINVDFVESAMGSGFSITSNMQMGNSACGSSCSC